MHPKDRERLVDLGRAVAIGAGIELEQLAHICNAAEPDPAAEVAARKRAALGRAYEGAMAPFRDAIIASTSPEDAMRRLREIYSTWSPERLAAELEAALQLCAAHGAADALS